MRDEDATTAREAASESLHDATVRGAEPGATPGALRQWRSLGERRSAGPEAQGAAREFPDGADVLDLTEMSRRTLLGVMGASLALTGCSKLPSIRKPAETILPHARRPEDLVPGRPVTYATSAWFGGTTLGLLVESQDGRPTKVEGNPIHPMSLGGTHAFAQACVLDVYDPDRSPVPLRDAAPSAWADLDAGLAAASEAVRGARGQGLAVLVDAKPSPTVARLLAEARAALPGLALYRHDAAGGASRRAAMALLGAPGALPLPDLSAADVVLALDCDYLGIEGDVVRNARQHAARRSVTAENPRMNRLYVAEPSFTTTGMMADHRLRVTGRDVRGVIEGVARRIFDAGASVPAGAEALAASLGPGPPEHARFLDAVAADLASIRGRALVLAGDRQPVEVHVLAHLANAALGAHGGALRFAPDPLPAAGTLADLVASMRAGAVTTLLVLGRNPVHEAPGDLAFAEAFAKVGLRVHVGLLPDETGRASSWHVPAAHDLESWGDLVAHDGTASLQQPLIQPLHGGLTDAEVLARILHGGAPKGHDLVRATWRAAAADDASFEKAWRQWLHDGVVGRAADPMAPALSFAGVTVDAAPAAGQGLELDFFLGTSVHDGRFANNAWLVELPDPMTKLSWDNAACLSPRTADSLGVADGDVVAVEAGGRALEIPALVTPGVADEAVILTLGYGHRVGHRVSEGVGFDVGPLRAASSPWIQGGAALRRTGATHSFARTQLHHTLTEPITGHVRDNVVRETTPAGLRDDPGAVARKDFLPPERIHSLWEEPNERGGEQWGMTIDLSTCIGCNACTVACQSENNIPVVGRDRVAMGREMHWIRLDRYYTGDEDDPQAVVQPIPCMQCENAPCEQVCPVAATTHSPDGLNDMAYNRCIGTRYCANNCPYKVRRFNFFNFAKENDERTEVPAAGGGTVPLAAFQRNPDVSVRFRGVMEKCTYCTQRISAARIASKVDGTRIIPDGAVVPACAQACPPKAITFGNVNDPESAVSKAKAGPRNYGLLTDLNTKPRTTYLARVRNPNPALGPA